jgi:hypothetical protein
MKVKVKPFGGPEREYELEDLEAMYAREHPEVERLIGELFNAMGRTVKSEIEWEKIRSYLDDRMWTLWIDVLDCDDGTWNALKKGRRMAARAQAKLAKAALTAAN